MKRNRTNDSNDGGGGKRSKDLPKLGTPMPAPYPTPFVLPHTHNGFSTVEMHASLAEAHARIAREAAREEGTIRPMTSSRTYDDRQLASQFSMVWVSIREVMRRNQELEVRVDQLEQRR